MSETHEFRVTYADGHTVLFYCSAESAREFIHAREHNHYKVEHGEVAKVETMPPRCPPGPRV